MMTMRRFAGLLVLAAAVPAAAQSAYRWVDKEGHVQYSDQPPPQAIKQFDERNLQPNRGNAQVPFATRKAASDYPVTLYVGKGYDKACDDARALLGKRGIPFTEVSLETAEDVAGFKKRFGQEPFVPSLGVGKELETGFAAQPWHSLLDKAGYPAGKR